MMIPIACFSFIIPEFTKPITITVVAEDDWITLVTAVPSATPLIGVFVIRYKNASSLFPATILSPSPISDIPNKNSATPHRSDKIIENICIVFSSVSFSFPCPRIRFPILIFKHLLFHYATLCDELQYFCLRKPLFFVSKKMRNIIKTFDISKNLSYNELCIFFRVSFPIIIGGSGNGCFLSGSRIKHHYIRILNL